MKSYLQKTGVAEERVEKAVQVVPVDQAEKAAAAAFDVAGGMAGSQENPAKRGRMGQKAHPEKTAQI